MKNVLIVVLLLLGGNSYSQNIDKITKKIVEEGKRLYRSEMTSWYGTDLFMERYPNRENIGGYFSYSQLNDNVCVFFSKDEVPKIIGTIKFDESFDFEKVNISMEERDFSDEEKEIYDYRQQALEVVKTDTVFKSYENIGFNLIPLIDQKEKKVYVLSAPNINDVVVFGNDYLITFDKNKKIKSVKSLHNNIIPIEFGEEIEYTMHTHLPETGDFITATDVCTLMLYGKFTGWERHNVASEKYLNVWTIDNNQLFVIKWDALEKIDESDLND